MMRSVEEADHRQWTLLPECLDDFIAESNPVRVIDVFVDTLDLAEMSFEGRRATPHVNCRCDRHSVDYGDDPMHQDLSLRKRAAGVVSVTCVLTLWSPWARPEPSAQAGASCRRFAAVRP